MICFRFLIPLINPLSLIIAFLSPFVLCPSRDPARFRLRATLGAVGRAGKEGREEEERAQSVASRREIRFPPCSAFSRSKRGNNGQRGGRSFYALSSLRREMQTGKRELLLGDDDYLWSIPLFFSFWKRWSSFERDEFFFVPWCLVLDNYYWEYFQAIDSLSRLAWEWIFRAFLGEHWIKIKFPRTIHSFDELIIILDNLLRASRSPNRLQIEYSIR